MSKLAALIIGFVWIVVACGPAPGNVEVPRLESIPPQESIPETFEEVARADEAGRDHAVEAALVRMAQSDDGRTRGRALVQLALLYEEAKRFDEAERLFREAIAANPSIAPFLQARLAGVLQDGGKTPEAVEAALEILVRHPDSSAADLARIQLPVLYATAERGDEVTRAVDAALRIEVGAFTEDELAAAADELERLGLPREAGRIRFRVLDRYPQGRHTEQLYRKLVQLDDSPLAALPYAQALELADRLGRVNRYDQALDLLERIRARFPVAASDASFTHVLATSLFNSRRYERVIELAPKQSEPHYLAIQLLRARAFWRTDRNREFLSLLDSILGNHPASREAANARLLLSRYHTIDEIDHAKAVAHLGQAIAAGLTGTDGVNIWNLGWIHTLARQDQRALATFDQYLLRHPDADYTTNALFWGAKIHERNGDLGRRDQRMQRLIDRYPTSYYSYRAREILGLAHPPPPAGLESAVPFAAAGVTAPDARVEMVRFLMDAGLEREAAREMQRLAAASSDDRVIAFTLADTYASAGQPLRAIVVLQRSFRNVIRHGAADVPRRFWEILYPRDHWETIVESAGKNGVDPFLIAAMIRQESAWEPSTVSSAGAVGLMQIMPHEASSIAAAAGLGAISREDLFDPSRNIAVGAAELRQKLDRMNGNRLLAIASYNAGEAAVGRWIAKTPLHDVDLFVESIPYDETRLYVKNVMRNYNEYRRIYGSP
ncbi:MAG TPA: transglycosylase SLT domain-containing protein [Thermoanaerobaculia bacterium]|nr:transglycosylase SLT domain-containing protein [Thermoanaerobaculia bacterium]